MAKDTLTPQSWIEAGFRALTAGGPQAIRAEAIARDLKVSKGSFYWHFLSVEDLKAQMLRHWEEVATQGIIKDVEAGAGTPADHLHALVRRATHIDTSAYGGAAVEAAIRDWGRYDPAVARSVAAVDARRMAFLRKLFKACGTTGGATRSRAAIFYGSLIGLETLASSGLSKPKADLKALLECLLADL